jgi:uncharacterized protein (TIGR03086 family)
MSQSGDATGRGCHQGGNVTARWHHGEMNEPEVFALADRTLAGVVARISPDQWDRTMPPDFAVRGGDGVPTLRQVINYHAYDDAWVPDMLAGRTMDEAGTGKFDGDLLGDDPVSRFDAIVAAACVAAARVTDLEQVAHLSFGDFTIREYLWQINFFRGVRAHEIARLIGSDLALPPDLVTGLWEEVSPNAEEWRGLGVFGPAVAVPDGAPLLDRLLGLTGRDPYAEAPQLI